MNNGQWAMNFQSSIFNLQFSIFICLLLLCGCTDSELRRSQLHDLQVRNEAGALMTDDSLAAALCTWADGHGTPADRLLAHYLMGRTWADKGEAPRALEEYHTAASLADTTDTHCDYRLLCRVYSQMADIFYSQNLLRNSLNCFQQSILHAHRAGDTVAALNSYGQTMAIYERWQMPDSVVQIYENLYERCKSTGNRQLAVCFSGLALESYIRIRDIGRAKQILSMYERESGYFDAKHNIVKGREIFYYIKGRYFLLTQGYDSAEYYFRKELCCTSDFNNQNAASHGLAQLYKEIGRPDSAAKYAQYAYDMNDSVYSEMATDEMKQVQGLYNYTRYQEMAQKEQKLNMKMKHRSLLLYFLVVCLTIILAVFFLIQRAKNKANSVRYKNLLRTAAKLQTEILNLKSDESAIQQMLKEKEQTIENLLSDIRRLQTKTLNSESKLKKSSVFQSLMKKRDTGSSLSEEEWQETYQLIMEVFPSFYQMLLSYHHLLNTTEYHICMLLRLHVNQSSVSSMLDITPAYTSKVCKKLLKVLFDMTGTGKDLVAKLCEIC